MIVLSECDYFKVFTHLKGLVVSPETTWDVWVCKAADMEVAAGGLDVDDGRLQSDLVLGGEMGKTPGIA